MCCRGVSAVMGSYGMIQEKQFIFGKNFPILLLRDILNTSTFKVSDVLHWVNFTYSNIFRSTFCWAGNIWIYFISYLFSIVINKLCLDLEFLHYHHQCFCWYCWWWGFFSVFSRSWIHILPIRSHHPCIRHWNRITVLRTAATV